MRIGLLLVCIFFIQTSFAQKGMLFVKKHGYKRVAVFVEGDFIKFRLKDRSIIEGYIALIKNDSIYVNGVGFDKEELERIIIRKNDAKGLLQQFMITTAASAALVGILYLGDKDKEDPDIIPKVVVISYAPFVIRGIKFLKRKKYSLGKKFKLQTVDLHFNDKKYL
ncbi:MAG: hypothetical protein ACXWV9_03215 [Flavisolibacter sp.]